MATEPTAGIDDAQIDRLYALPLESFTAERNDLAKRLRKEGQRAAADVVAKLPKPSPPAWAVNQLARERPDQLAALLAATDDLRRAHAGTDGEFRAAREAEQRALEALVTSGRDLLAAHGRRPTEATLRRVRATLEAAAADPATRVELERGRLTHELASSGFDLLAGAIPESRRPNPSGRRGKSRVARPTAAERGERAAERRRQIEQAREAVVHARNRARRLRDEAEDAERAAKRAREKAARAEDDLMRAEERLDSVRRS